MKILIVKLSSLGDVVHAMPAVQDIRRAFPEARIDWVVERAGQLKKHRPLASLRLKMTTGFPSIDGWP